MRCQPCPSLLPYSAVLYCAVKFHFTVVTAEMLVSVLYQAVVCSWHAVANVEQNASHAMGMTLSQYMSQMPSREAAAGER